MVAYHEKVIDEHGNVLISKEKRTPEQNESFGKIDVFCRNMKRIYNVYQCDSKFALYSASLYLLKENKKEQ